MPSQLLALNPFLGRCYHIARYALNVKVPFGLLISRSYGLSFSSMCYMDPTVRFSKLRNHLITSFPQPHRRPKFCIARISRYICVVSSIQHAPVTSFLSRCCSKRPAGASSNSFLTTEITLSKKTTKILRAMSPARDPPQEL